ncbi:MAG: 4-carboxy-4-hydroxy-2-oxoadipate aldolase/oxaloacetate decarboxylase [Armatimonadetes bacterium]|nr:4-carboxy-4-hydroxy-2-oxoadipate aldolase/oxaloacetate decarboxylase [Armatimonadota bacterium]
MYSRPLTPHVIRTIRRPPAEVIKALSRFDAAHAHEGLGQRGAMHSRIKPIAPGMRVCGPAVTVWSPPSDDLILQKAIEVAQPGDVIVAEVGGDTEAGVWGEIMSYAAHTRGIAGLVVNGSVRDVRATREMGFAIFAAGICMKGTGKDHLGYVNHPMSCAGVLVHPGDVILGDDDGVVVIPREEAEGLVEICRNREKREEEWKALIRAGKTSMDFQNLRPLFASKGLIEE